MTSKNSVKEWEVEVLKTAAKKAKGQLGKAAASMLTGYNEKDEKQLRDKLVRKLKQKEQQRIDKAAERLKTAKEDKDKYEHEEEHISAGDTSEDEAKQVDFSYIIVPEIENYVYFYPCFICFRILTSQFR